METPGSSAGDLDIDDVPIFHSYSPETNAKCRSKGLIHTRSKPFALLVVFRQLYEPVRMLATAKIHLCSRDFEAEQEAAAAKARLIKGPPFTKISGYSCTSTHVSEKFRNHNR